MQIPPLSKYTFKYVLLGIWDYEFIILNVPAKGYKSVVLNFGQIGTNNPFVFEVGTNDFGASISWSRTAGGVYVGSLNGAFDSNKSVFLYSITGPGRQAQCLPVNSNSMQITSQDFNGTLQDGIYMYLEVRLYP